MGWWALSTTRIIALPLILKDWNKIVAKEQKGKISSLGIQLSIQLVIWGHTFFKNHFNPGKFLKRGKFC